MMAFRSPTEEQVREALRRVPTPQLRRAFFSGLKNPLWLEPLRRAGVFQNPPSRVVMPDGQTGDPYWPELEYLIRVAPDAPSAAIDILIGLQESDNAWVRRSLFAVGSVVPASEAKRLKPVLKAWMGSGFGWRTDPREMVSFAINLVRGGERVTGEWVANVLFRPATAPDSRVPVLAMDDYWYEVGLPQVTAALGNEGLPLVLVWLREYENAAGHADGWPLHRPSIGERSDLHHGVEDALIDAVRDLAIERARVDPMGAATVLLTADFMLARRIAMYALALVLSETEPGAESATLAEAGASVLFETPTLDERYRVEFGELAREVARHDPEALGPLVELIAAGPESDDAPLRTRLRRDEEESEEEIDHRVAEFTERWEHKWLAAVGPAALPAVLADRLAGLEERLGSIDDPLRPPFMITTWSGPNSPLTQDELASMTPEELVSHLESWHDFGDGWGPEPSHEGQARELMSVLTSNPALIGGVSDLVRRLRPTYLRAIVGGWEAAYKAGLDLDWAQVEATVRQVMDHGDELDAPREGGDMDDDPDFTWAKKAAVGLLDEVVKKTEPRRVPEEYLAEFASLLISLDTEAPWGAYAAESREGGMDPLTLSMNWQWPVHLRGLAGLVVQGPDNSWSDDARRAFLREVRRDDPRGASNAVIAEYFGRFLTVDKDWAESHTAEWFGTESGLDRGQQIALSTMMAIHHYHQHLYRLFTPSILGALSLPEPIAAGWEHANSTPRQRIGEWALKALLYGHVDWTDPVVAAFFNEADAVDRGAALGRIAWEFMHAEAIDDSIRDRFAGVWDARFAHVEGNPADSAELRQFYWVVRSGKFSARWWLPRFLRALQLDDGLAIDTHAIGKQLAQGADADPAVALEIAKLLMTAGAGQNRAFYDLSQHVIPIVLARALDSGDHDLRAAATNFMNELGEAGHTDLKLAVDEVLRGEVSTDDVPD